ncbi:MAG: universal stress protein [Verrucomicrobia subdivision 3 bacterium]|nr:universal stress protein [Limisphaerales bacterium]
MTISAASKSEGAGLAIVNHGKSMSKKSLLDHLLVPVDFSDCSKGALRYAQTIAADFGSKVTVLNVTPLNDGLLHLGADQLKTLDEELRENQRRKLVGFVKRASRSLEPAQCVVRLGHPVEEIIREAEDIGAAAIVISTRGLSGIRHAVIGSTAERVVRHAKCPVWVVPGRKRL